jgi:phosphoserine phosphatase
MQNKLLAILLVAACGDSTPALTPDAPPPPPPDSPPPPVDLCDQTPSDLRTDLPWFGDNRATLQAWLDSAGCKSATYDKAHKPVALWDWDNTISKNDFGDAITYWFVANGKVLQPPNQDWHQTNPFLTDAAATALSTACGTTVAAGQPLPTNTSAYASCADEILWIYDNEETRAHAPAFGGANARRNEPDFAWTPQLMAGYTHAEIQAFTSTMLTQMLGAAPDTTQTIGTTTGENGWLRIYDQQKDLIHAAQTRGYDVWIITASPQDVIGTAAAMVGVPFDHVIGIRSMTDGAGKLLYTFEGCGPYADGQTQMIPYIQGKRCYVNKVAFGDTTATAIERRLEGQRQVFASGDSDSDVEFLRDAKYKLSINRNKGDLMCHAYNNEHDTWRVQPMFIEPKAAKATAYGCATAFVDEAGVAGASRDEGGNVIADQSDTAHP